MTSVLHVEIAPSWRRRVDRSGGPGACWPWRGALMTNGYGQTRVKMDGRWRGAGAHQVAYYVATGRWERKAEGRLVRHRCHNRPCCNPLHLLGGTHQDNANDRAERVARLRRPPALPLPACRWMGQMTGRVVDMNRERWLGLANAAMAAVADPTAKRRETLKLAAGRMVSATPPSTEPAAMSLCLSFRWGCVAFATSPGGVDQQLAGDALVKLGMMIRRLFGHVSPPTEPVSAVAPPPVQAALDLPEHPWMQRRDIGGA